MPDLGTSQSLLLQQLHFLLKHWSSKGIICMYSIQRGKTGGPLSQYTVLWCGRLTFKLLLFQTADEHPKHSAVVSVPSWLSEYWIIYHNGLVSDSNTNFTPLLYSGLPSVPPMLLNYQLICLTAASYLCLLTQPRPWKRKKPRYVRGLSYWHYCCHRTGDGGYSQFCKDKKQQQHPDTDQQHEKGAECSMQLSGPSSSPPENKWQARWNCPLGQFQLQQLAESLKQRYGNLSTQKKPQNALIEMNKDD